MLEFAACEFLELSHRFGLLLGQYRKNPDPNVLGNSLDDLITQSGKLGLKVTHGQILCWVSEIVQRDPGSVDASKLSSEGRIGIVNAHIDSDRVTHHVEMLYSTMILEMRNILFRAVPSERAVYYDPMWLADTQIPTRYPTSLAELQRAGICYALGQATASVFHSMRALEPGLASLAGRFSIPSDQGNWQTLIEQIEKEVRKLGNQATSPQKMEDEKFFGGATSYLYFVKNAWRNHVAHRRDNYADDDAFKVLNNTRQFIESLCPRLQEP